MCFKTSEQNGEPQTTVKFLDNTETSLNTIVEKPENTTDSSQIEGGLDSKSAPEINIAEMAEDNIEKVDTPKTPMLRVVQPDKDGLGEICKNKFF